MGRYLMSSKERLKLEAFLRDMTIKEEERLSMSTAHGIGGLSALASGQNHLSNAALGLFGPDGSIDRVGNIYLPAKYKGQTISSAEEATSAAEDFIAARINVVAKQENRFAQCVLNCIEGSPVFKLIKNGMTGDEPYDHMAKPQLEGQYYDPPVIYIATVLGQMQQARYDVLRDKFIGFPVK